MEPEQGSLHEVIRTAIEEYVQRQQSQGEPAYLQELQQERQRREQLERRMAELLEESRKSRAQAAEAERSAKVRQELQRLGVSKVDLAFSAVKERIATNDHGELVALDHGAELPLEKYLQQFVTENPELLPARQLGGSGVLGMNRMPPPGTGRIDLDQIRPGMAPEELERARQEIARLAGQHLRGQ